MEVSLEARNTAFIRLILFWSLGERLRFPGECIQLYWQEGNRYL